MITLNFLLTSLIVVPLFYFVAKRFARLSKRAAREKRRRSGSLAAVAELKDLAAILRTDTGVNTVFSLDIPGEGVNDVIFQDRQIDAIRGRLIHAEPAQGVVRTVHRHPAGGDRRRGAPGVARTGRG